MDGTPGLRVSWTFVAFLLLAGCWAAFERNGWSLPWGTSHVFEPDAMNADSGFAYTVALPAFDASKTRATLFEGVVEANEPLGWLEGVTGDTFVHRYANAWLKHRFQGLASRIDWRPLGPGEQQHDDIRRKGGGRYSAWHGTLYFAATDSSDPRVNNRAYRIDLHPPAPQLLRVVLVAVVILLGFRLALRAVRGSALLRDHSPGIWISVLLVAIILASAEAWLRATVPFAERSGAIQRDPVAGVTFKPGSESRHTNQVEFWTSERMNSLGFADREPAIPKPAGTFRVLVVGDSFVEALQVAREQRLQVLLERRLRAAFPGRALDVVAMGYSGTGQSAQLSFVEKHGAALAPDLVILLMVENDLGNNSPILESIAHGWHPYHTPRLFYEVDPAPPGFRRIDIEADWERYTLLPSGPDFRRDRATRLRILRRDPAFRARLDGWNYPDDLDQIEMFCAEEMPPVFRDAEAITEHAFKMWAERGRRDGFKILVAAGEGITSTCARAKSARRFIAPGRMLARASGAVTRAGLPLLDLYPAFAAHGDVTRARFRYDPHWKAIGHEWAAEAIAAYLVANPPLMSR